MALNNTLHAMDYRQVHAQTDEGYSEDTQSQPGGDMDTAKPTRPLTESVKLILRSLDALPVEERNVLIRLAAGGLTRDDQLALAKDLVFALPTSAKQAVSSHLDSLLFFDPVIYFPYEIVQAIFGHLTPKDLLVASAVNREWRERTQDEELWRACFGREGWQINHSKVKAFEQQYNTKNHKSKKQLLRKDSRKRRREEAFSEAESAAPQSDSEPDSLMEGVESTSAVRLASADNSMSVPESSFHDSGVKLRPTVWQSPVSTSRGAKVSWAYVYKQRRLLERNWDEARYQMFRLPALGYEAEGHAECVYTIQHVSSTLVSGSRDRTIRRWDLNSQRLIGQPLHGHEASVLCLQFDPTPENDIIVSGGSDSWVIIWRFSTGEIIKKMTTAHYESVLNLRFDHRYIVTCSKDKTIKIWNRREISRDDPVLPAHVLPHFADPTAESMIKEHTLLATLHGHHAAVNAVMIHADTIVSASGDRTIKSWNINSGKCDKTYTGHTKGIACVQYDGRRIVSGSSDNSVRIFDAERQAEMACLQAHNNLVRTVQARFGDLETRSDEELEEEARQSDREWREAMARGMQPASGSRSGARNAGSSRPEDVLVLGAKIPHGGGGSKWARIVSGSYDETVIVWKKGVDGKWFAKNRLTQESYLRSRHRPRQMGANPQTTPAHPNSNVNAQTAAVTAANAAATTATNNQLAFQQMIQQNQHLAGQVMALSDQIAATPAPGHANNQHQQQLAPLAAGSTASANAAGPSNAQASSSNSVSAPPPAATQAAQAAVHNQHGTQIHQTTQTTQTVHTTHHHNHHHNHQQQQQQLLQPPQAHPQQAASPSQALHHPPGSRESNRVFKLQFDPRRLICCSQNKVIVGWDFADKNEDLARVGDWCEETY